MRNYLNEYKANLKKRKEEKKTIKLMEFHFVENSIYLAPFQVTPVSMCKNGYSKQIVFICCP